VEEKTHQMNTVPDSDELLLIGRIGTTFGVRGQIRLQSISDQPGHLVQHVRTLYIGSKRVPYQVVSAFEHKRSMIVLTLKGVTTPEAAQSLRHAEVFIREVDSAPLAADEYFLHQLYGLRVETDAGATLGEVRDVIETGANEVLVVARPGASDLLIPMIRDVIAELDLAAGRVVIRLMEGLLE
jgi:16S rRNA processing protein RimM